MSGAWNPCPLHASQNKPCRECALSSKGEGLTSEALQIVAENGSTVHLRIASPSGGYPHTSCGEGLGEWWSGRADEVSCPRCIKEMKR